MNDGPGLILVAGCSGGVGKSLVSMAMVDWLIHAKGQRVLVVESDNHKSDVYKVYKPPDAHSEQRPDAATYPQAVTVHLETEEGWGFLTNLCEQHSGAHVVVNTRGANLGGLLDYSGEFLEAIAQEFGRPVTMLWVINDERDSVELLLRYMNEGLTPNVRLHVVCNRGTERGRVFTLYEESDAPMAVNARGGLTITIPTLGKPASAQLYTHRMQITEVVENKKNFRVSVRTMMKRWRTPVWGEFEKLHMI